MKSRGNLVCSLILMGLIGCLPFLASYSSNALAIAWASAVLVALSFYAGFGFWSVGVVIWMVHRITSIEVEINPFNSDLAGGLGRVKNFVTTTTGLFFTGGLAVPAALDLARGKGVVLTWSLLVFYLGLGIVVYFAGQRMIAKKISAEKQRMLKDVASRLKKLYESGGPTAEIERWRFYQSSVERMKDSAFTLPNWFRVVSRASISAMPFVFARVFPQSDWAKWLAEASPIFKGLLSP